ncbi:IclR family transcriptional regulator [Agrobacterium sp. SHOUNA12C]|uniref:IclR family transcriptional regulator n=1 Tax=Rhizobium rhizogenes TaxID=359 RepID=UPI001574E368|nr:IclR family transcriptional regulator [Rhizobium rhizogenes]MCJ9721779.1 IclR family transcriptional regulator [Agrobacterium sp. BETTINA12B]MCJ9756515.1 IclR family transcriptional regulator [Agrobacterium sp. SHOUNA12C]NTF52100.1 IclR family transcriptional regulator [Rhizobium rhizogenes]NTG17644.1 IclR family transcriptional regulator [Rhizobium rhizogenes]NTG24304.1 IclR family transcriptional regulator [Rhizobium rhizogenes]
MNSEVKSAGRVLDILEYMAGRREAVALSQIVRDLTLPKSSAHGLLQTLAARGHLVQDSAGRYMLIEAGRHGFPFRRHEEPLVVKAMPFMERLRDESGETVLLSAMNAHCDIRRLAKSVSRQPIRYDVNLDAAIVAYCTAMGRVLLAHAPQQTLEDYLSRVQFLSYTPYTITNVQEIRNILIKVRQDGYAINDQEFVTGSTGIAMPVFDATGNVAAALNLGTLTSRYIERHEALLSMLRKTSADISRSLGYRVKP